MPRPLIAAVIAISSFVTLAAQSTPRVVADELLAADRAFSAASAKTDLIAGIAAIFAADVSMPAPTGIAYGATKAVEALKANPANAGAKAVWTPTRVGVSGDGSHGFTAGVMTMTRADGTINPAKYLAYWEKQEHGWRALAYKRVPSQLKTPSLAVTYVLPKTLAAAKTAAAVARDRDSLAEAERSFSRDAQTMGIGAAFTRYGHADAINLFGGTDAQPFTLGNAAIGEQVGRDSPPNTSPVHWGPEKTVIAASGDFGVTIGYIVQNKPGADPSTGSGQGGKLPPGQPFFTIWTRTPSGEWKYVAE